MAEEGKRSTGKKRLLFALVLILLVVAALAIGITLNLVLKSSSETARLVCVIV